MPSPDQHTISLSAERASYVDTAVASEAYATASDVVWAGLHALQERDEAIEQWLRDEGVPVAAAMQADPSRAILAEQVSASLRAFYAEGLDTSRGDVASRLRFRLLVTKM